MWVIAWSTPARQMSPEFFSWESVQGSQQPMGLVAHGATHRPQQRRRRACVVAEELADIGRVARADSDRLVCLCLPIFGIRPPGRVLGAGRGLLSVFRQDESGRAEFALGGSAAALIVSHLLRDRITYATECTASRKFKGFVRLAFQ